MAQKRVKNYDYIKRSDISVLKATVDGKVLNVDPKKILSGTYVAGKVTPTAKKLRVAKIDPFKLKEKIFSKAKEVMGNEYETEYEKFVLAKDLKAFIECGLTEEMIMAFYLGFKAVVTVTTQGEYADYGDSGGIFGYRTDGGYIERAIERAIYNCENKCFEIGFKYPDFNWKKAGMKISKTEVVETPEYEFMGKKVQDILKIETFTVKKTFKVLAVKSVGRKENGKLVSSSSYGTPEERDPKKPLELNGGYLAIVSRNAKDLFALAIKLLTQENSYTKDFDWLIQTKTKGAQTLNESGVKYAKGGKLLSLSDNELRDLRDENESEEHHLLEAIDNEDDRNTKTHYQRQHSQNKILYYKLKREFERRGLDMYAKGGVVMPVQNLTSKYSYLKRDLSSIKGDVEVRIEKRNLKGLSGSQDPFDMVIYQKGKKIAYFGTHPSQSGAEKMLKNLKGETYAEGGEIEIEFEHKGNKHKHTFTPEEEDWWTNFESNGNSYDVHYDEDYGTISVYEYSDKGTDYANTVYSKKIMVKGGDIQGYAEGGEVRVLKDIDGTYHKDYPKKGDILIVRDLNRDINYWETEDDKVPESVTAWYKGRGNEYMLGEEVEFIDNGKLASTYFAEGGRIETLTRLNGNRQEYTLPLPKISILTSKINDTALTWIDNNTGLKFRKTAWAYEAQPKTSAQIVKLLTMSGTPLIQFQNNATNKNVLYMKYYRDDFLHYKKGGGVNKANVGGYIAVAEKAKGLAPKSFDAIDTKVANKVSKKTFSERMSETGSEEYDRDAYQANTEFAKGGLLEHGLQMGDTIIGYGLGDGTVVVENGNMGKATVNLNTGERYSHKSMEKGGGVEVFKEYPHYAENGYRDKAELRKELEYLIQSIYDRKKYINQSKAYSKRAYNQRGNSRNNFNREAIERSAAYWDNERSEENEALRRARSNYEDAFGEKKYIPFFERYAKGGSLGDAEYVPQYEVLKVKLKNGKVIENSYNNQIYSGLRIGEAINEQEEMEAMGQMRLFQKGGRMPEYATYISARDIDTVYFGDEDDPKEVRGSELKNGIWYDNESGARLVAFAKSKGYLK